MEIEREKIDLIKKILSIIKDGEEYYVGKEGTPELEYAKIKVCAEYIKENKLAKFVGIFIDGISIRIIKENGLLFLDNPPIVKEEYKPNSKPKKFFNNKYVSGIIIALASAFIIWIIALLYHKLQ